MEKIDDEQHLDNKSLDFLSYSSDMTQSTNEGSSSSVAMETGEEPGLPNLDMGEHELDFQDYPCGQIENSVVDFIPKKSLDQCCDEDKGDPNDDVDEDDEAETDTKLNPGVTRIDADNGSVVDSAKTKQFSIPNILASEEMKTFASALLGKHLHQETKPSNEQSGQIILLSAPNSSPTPSEKFLLIPLSSLSSLQSVKDLIPTQLDLSDLQAPCESMDESTLVVDESVNDLDSPCKVGSQTHNSQDGGRVTGSGRRKMRLKRTIECLLGGDDQTDSSKMYKIVNQLKTEKSEKDQQSRECHVELSSQVPELCSVEDENDARQTLLSQLSNTETQLSLLNSETFERMTLPERMTMISTIADDMVENLQGVKKWKCRYCDKSYTSKHNLVIHILGHFNIRPHCCMECGKFFKQVSHLNTHMRTHSSDRPYKCEVCDKNFNQSAHLIRHRMLHSDKPKPFQCDRCPRGFVYPSELKTHQVRHDARDKSNADAKGVDNGDGTTANDRTCKECGKLFPYPSLLRDHMIKHSGDRPHMCRECGMEFMKPHHLRTHELTHSGEKPHKCQVCDRGFTLKSNMLRHLSTHFPSKSFKCEECGKGFTQKQVLQAHMVTHNEKKPYSCEICGKPFSRLHNLHGHMTLHNMNKKYVCFCGRSFTLKGNLNRHQKDVHKMSKFTKTSEYSAEEAAQVLNLMSQGTNQSKSPGGDNSDLSTADDHKESGDELENTDDVDGD